MKRRISCLFPAAVAVLVLFAPVTLCAQEESVAFTSDRWEILQGEVKEFEGRNCLCGTATLKDVDFRNGVIEVDQWADGKRSYPGFIFRFQSLAEYERFYIRPHVNGKHDALQYTPVFNGIAGWQLYSGDGFTAAADFPEGRWFTVRMELLGNQARVFVDGAEEPALVIHDLKHGDVSGAIGVLGEPAAVSCFSNFRYRQDDALAFDPPPERESPLGTITEWEISRVYPYSRVDLEKHPDAQGLGGLEWKKVNSEPSGLVDVARHVPRVGDAADCVFARTVIHAEKERTMALQFGYSDAVSLFLNGRLLFYGSSGYHQRDPSFMGIVGYNDTVFLPLNKGDNELTLLLTDNFGGWGFMCRDGDAVFQHADLQKLWELSHTLNYPESAALDPARGILYVSNFMKPGGESISRVSLDGKVLDLEWSKGLTRPSGLTVHGGRLYAVDRLGLAVIDPETAQIVDRITIPDGAFLNDVALDDLGAAYITDSRKGVILRVLDGKSEVWLESDEIGEPNGICVDGARLVVGDSEDGCFKAIDLGTKRISTLACLGPGSILDGLKPDGEGGFIVSDYNGRVFRISPEGGKTLLLNSKTPERLCADLEYVPGKRLLVIPSLFDNRLTAYRLK